MTTFARFKPLVRPFLQKVLKAKVHDIEVLQPEERQSIRPTSLLPGMLERVTNVTNSANLPAHLKRARAKDVTHAALLKWTLRNVLVFPSGFSTWTECDTYGTHIKLKELSQTITHIPKVRYCGNSLASIFFGHWMADAAPTSLIEPQEGHAWMFANPSWQHAIQYVDIFELDPIKAPLVHAEEMIMYQDFGQGSHKRERYRQLRSNITSRFGQPETKDLVYLMRGSKGERRAISNEERLIEELAKRGWKIVNVDEADVNTVIGEIVGAQLVVGMEGSHLNHAQFGLQSGCGLVVLTPADRFVTHHIDRATANNVSSGMLVLNGNKAKGYHVDIDELLRTVDLTLSD